MKVQLIRFALFAVAIPFLLVCTSFAGLRMNEVKFTGFFGSDTLAQNKNYFSATSGDSVSVSTCRFYISDFRLYQGHHVVATKDYKLVDLFDSSRNSFPAVFHIFGNVTEIRFYLGIDSAANVSGANKGELDPMNGMYWAWQSGYINLKLEGKSKLCQKNRGEFQYHLGGYAAPHNARKEVIIKLNEDRGNFEINVDVQKLLEQINMKETTHVMSPSEKGVELSGKAVSMFSVK